MQQQQQPGRPSLDSVMAAALGQPQHDPVRGAIGTVSGIGSGLGGLHNTSAVGAMGPTGLPSGPIGNGMGGVGGAGGFGAGAVAGGGGGAGVSYAAVLGTAPGPGQGQGQAVQGPAPQDQQIPLEALRASFSEPMGNILRFMDAVRETPPDRPQDFRAVWGTIGSPSSVSAMANALNRDMAIPPRHLVDILARTEPDNRSYLHSQIQDLSEKIKGEMPEFIQALMLTHWLMRSVLPTLQSAGLPEDATFGTSSALAKNYNTVLEACTIGRPDAMNPTCVQLKNQVGQLEAVLREVEGKAKDAVAQEQGKVAQHAQRLEKLGFALAADEALDRARVKQLAKSQTSMLTALTITGFVLFGVVLVVLVVLLVLRTKKSAQALGGGPSTSYGGGFGGVGVGVAGAAAGIGAGLGLGADGSVAGFGAASPRSMFGAPQSNYPAFELSREWR